MTTTPNLTRDIGQAERTMRALLERLLDEADLSFPEWTVLVFLDGAGPLTAGPFDTSLTLTEPTSARRP
jgi:hypothetical protein